MKRYIFALLVLISLDCVSQGVEVFDSMDMREYNATLRIWQTTVNGRLDVYKAVLVMSDRVMVIERKSDGNVMEFEDVRVFREEGGVFVFSAWFVGEDWKYPASGVMFPGGLRINLGDVIYIFSQLEVEGDETT